MKAFVTFSSPESSLFSNYSNRAKKEKKQFNLSLEEFLILIKGPCHYCGEPPNQLFRKMKYNGIDRVNNDKGYIHGNCVSCCKHCNRAKSSLVLDTFLDWVNRLIKYSVKQKDLTNLKAFLEECFPKLEFKIKEKTK